MTPPTKSLARAARDGAPPFLDDIRQDVVQRSSLVQGVVAQPIVEIRRKPEAEELVIRRLPGSPRALREIFALHATESYIRYQDCAIFCYR